MTTNTDLHDAQVKLASAQAQYEALQAEEKRLTEVRRQLATSKEQTQQAIAQLKTANEQAVKNRIEAETAAMILHAAEEEAAAARIDAAARQKTAHADRAAELVNSIQASAQAADAALSEYTAQLVKISQAKRQLARTLAQDFEIPGHAAPSPTVAQEIQAGKQVLEALDRENNALDVATPVSATQGKAASYAALANTLIGPYVSK